MKQIEHWSDKPTHIRMVLAFGIASVASKCVICILCIVSEDLPPGEDLPLPLLLPEDNSICIAQARPRTFIGRPADHHPSQRGHVPAPQGLTLEGGVEKRSGMRGVHHLPV
eukprot:CAMPEP_0196594988 /NCGR_PEP_ID=MMETSP1081-20130531/79858_1 /TAXON_ID=36882 /ORGANISM="Pyramimonas amylifera, Strain CCMP720" /LENGTH=110 /DNA_ID=CAMNT_0041919413 /DNA_START=329 /DNA_END=661 /DNA_ORIENTATION=+